MNVWEAIQEQFAIDIPFENYVAVDDAILTGETMTEEDIVQSVRMSKEEGTVKTEEPDEEEEDTQENVPENTAQCLEFISGIHNSFIHQIFLKML